MDYADNKNILKAFYERAGLVSKFDSDIAYLDQAFSDIDKLWQDNFDQIKTVNYLMIAEAPLWGKKKKYIYNPDTNNSQIFYRSDLGDVLNRPIADKRAFIKVCNEIGLIVVDISPFPLNKCETAINYREDGMDSRKLTEDEYKQLVRLTMPKYFVEKIKEAKEKKSSDIKTVIRYAGVRDIFQELISEVLIDNEFIKHINEIGYISKQGGSIDREKLKLVIRNEHKKTA